MIIKSYNIYHRRLPWKPITMMPTRSIRLQWNAWFSDSAKFLVSFYPIVIIAMETIWETGLKLTSHACMALHKTMSQTIEGHFVTNHQFVAPMEGPFNALSPTRGSSYCYIQVNQWNITTSPCPNSNCDSVIRSQMGKYLNLKWNSKFAWSTIP